MNLKYLLWVLHQPHRETRKKITLIGRKKTKKPCTCGVLVSFLYQQDEGQLLAVRNDSLKFLSNVLVPEVPTSKGMWPSLGYPSLPEFS